MCTTQVFLLASPDTPALQAGRDQPLQKTRRHQLIENGATGHSHTRVGGGTNDQAGQHRPRLSKARRKENHDQLGLVAEFGQRDGREGQEEAFHCCVLVSKANQRLRRLTQIETSKAIPSVM